MCLLINKSEVRKCILRMAQAHRPTWGCTRVSAEALVHIETHLLNFLYQLVESHPSIGKTFKP